MMERFDCKVTNKEKRKLSSLGLAIISITSHWKSILVSVLSLGLSGLLFVLAATYTASIDPESIVKKDVYQYGQFVIDTTGKYSEKVSEIENFKQKIMELPNISNIKQVVETILVGQGKIAQAKINFLLLPIMILPLFSNSENQAIWITNSLFNLTRSLL